MKICLTGGTGFLGSKISRFFEDNNFEIINISRQDFSNNTSVIASKITGSDMLINLAGVPILKRWSESYKKEIYDSRVKTTQKLVEAIKKVDKKPSIILSTSAVGIYDQIEVHDEFSDSLANDFLANVCKDWELALVPLAKMDIKLAIMRIGVVLDKKDGAFAKMLPSFKMGLGAIIGKGEQPFPCIHINDFLSAIWYILKNPDSKGVYNLVSPEIVSNEYFFKQLGKKLKRPVLMRINKTILRMVLRDGADSLLKGQKVKPQRLMDLGFPFQFPDVNSMLEDLLKK